MKGTLSQQLTAAPVGLTPDAATTFRPLPVPASLVVSGFWAQRQRVNRSAAIPAGLRQLRAGGAFRNLRRAAGSDDGQFEGPVFIDSDMYKWLEAIAWEQAREPSQTLAAEQAEATALIAEAQRPDGYLNSFVQVARGNAARFTDLTSGHELYCAGHLIQAAVAQQRATGHGGLLEVAIRFADLLAGTFGPGKRPELDGHPLIEMALIELYRETGAARYLELARHFIEARGSGQAATGPHSRPRSYYSDRVPVRQAATVEGHAVRALYLAAGAADLAAETGDDELLAALERQWHEMVTAKTYLTGGLGARWDGEAFGAPYELPPDRAYCETCAAIASVQWSWRMLLRTGDPRYADLIERTLYNAVMPGMSLDGTAYFYANPLQVRSCAADDEPRNAANGRSAWYDVACCPPNIMRTISSLGSLLATGDDDGIQIHQYAASTITAGSARLSVVTDYPWDGRIEITVQAPPDHDWSLSLRIPAWCDGARARTGETGTPEACQPGTYLRLRRRWTAGASVVLELPMPVRRTAAHPRVDAVRGCVAIERGPLVYCVEQADQPAGVLVDDLRLADGECTAAWNPDLLGGVTVVQATGWLGHAARLTAIPYFAWANRGPGPMRVWIPLARPDLGGDQMRTRTLLLVPALGAALGLAGCASTTPSAKVTAASFGENATGVVQFWDRNTTSPFGKLLVDRFNATHKNLKVVLTPVQDTQYVTKLATAIRAGSPPDLVGIDDINSQLFIYHKVFTDLTPLVNALPEKNKLSPGALNLTTENGRYYGTPYVADMSVLWYNKTLFRQAGLNPDKPPASYAEIISDARKITAPSHGIYGFAFAGRCEGCLGFTILPDVWATKKHLLNGQPGHETAFIQGNVPLRQTLAFYRQLWAGGLSDPESRVETGTTWGQNFLAGKIGMMPLGYGPIAAAPAKFQSQIGMTLLPAPSGGATATFDGGANFGIPTGSQNPSGAWEFVKFALQTAQQSLAPMGGFEPIRSDVLTPQFRAKYPFVAAMLQGLSRGYAPKTIVYNTTFNQPGGPWLNMFTAAVFDGDIEGAIRAGQAGFATAIDLGKS